MFLEKKYKFILYASLKTLYTFIVYQFALFFMNYKYAYIVCWIFGYIYGYISNSRNVFNKELKPKKGIQYFLWEVAYLGISILFVEFFVEKVGIVDRLAPIIVIAITFPVNYYVIKKIIN